VLAFKEVAAGFPEHPKAPAALLKMGYSYLGLNDPQNARDYLGRVERLYPESEAAPLARAALQQLDGRLEGPPAEAGKED
jgi:TolA-binding protein